MNLQVNFLNKNERRYQGVVGTEVIVISSVAVLIVVLAFATILTGISKMALLASLEYERDKSKQNGPVAATLRLQSAATEENKRTASMLDERSNRIGAPFFELMHELQTSVPSQVQLSRLYMGMLEAGSSKKPENVLQLSGQAVGEGSDLLVVEFKNDLNKSDSVTGFCGDVSMKSSRRESPTSWNFSLEGKQNIKGGQ